MNANYTHNTCEESNQTLTTQVLTLAIDPFAKELSSLIRHYSNKQHQTPSNKSFVWLLLNSVYNYAPTDSNSISCRQTANNNSQYTLKLDNTFLDCQANEQHDRIKSISETMIDVMCQDCTSVGLLKYLYPVNESLDLGNAVIMIYGMTNNKGVVHKQAVDSVELKINLGKINFIGQREYVDKLNKMNSSTDKSTEIRSLFEQNKFINSKSKLKSYKNEQMYKSAVSLSGDSFEEKGIRYEFDSVYFTHRIKINQSNDMQTAVDFLKNSVDAQTNMIKTESKQELISNQKVNSAKEGLELTLIPSIFERSPKNFESEISLKNTSNILGIINQSKFNSALEYQDNNEFKLSYDDFQTLNTNESTGVYKSIILKLTQNISLTHYESEQFFENVTKITTGLFKASKYKQLKVFNELLSNTPHQFILATSNEHYLVIKNQQLFELQIPDTVNQKQVTNFIKNHILDLALNKFGVILVYMHFKYIFDEQDDFSVNRLISQQHQFRQIEQNFNTIELYKTLVQYKQINTAKHPEQSLFFKQINSNICVLYKDIIYKELLYFIFKFCNTYDLSQIIKTVANNITHFFDNIYGIQIIKAIFEQHTSSNNFKLMRDVVESHLETIINSRFLNLLWFQFLAQDLYTEFAETLLQNTSEKAMKSFIRMLVSKVGFNSLSALIEKQGWEVIRPKFDYLKTVIGKYSYNNTEMILKSIQNLERDHQQEKSEPKFLVYEFVSKEN